MEIIEKGWGREIVIVNKPEYCGKILHMNKGKHMSFHFHCVKDETFFLNSGKVLLVYGESDDIGEAKRLMMNPGDSFHIPVGLRHRLIALEDSDVFEFSTEHFDEDSYRIEKGD